MDETRPKPGHFEIGFPEYLENYPEQVELTMLTCRVFECLDLGMVKACAIWEPSLLQNRIGVLPFDDAQLSTVHNPPGSR